MIYSNRRGRHKISTLFQHMYVKSVEKEILHIAWMSRVRARRVEQSNGNVRRVSMLGPYAEMCRRAFVTSETRRVDVHPPIRGVPWSRNIYSRTKHTQLLQILCMRNTHRNTHTQSYYKRIHILRAHEIIVQSAESEHGLSIWRCQQRKCMLQTNHIRGLEKRVYKRRTVHRTEQAPRKSALLGARAHNRTQ